MKVALAIATLAVSISGGKPPCPRSCPWYSSHDDKVRSANDKDVNVGFGYNDVRRAEPRDGIVGHNYRWPDGVVPYLIDKQSYDKAQTKLILGAMQELERATDGCLTFERRTKQEAYLWVWARNAQWPGCWTYIGRQGDRQELHLDAPCLERHIVMHELLHAVGFFHEHQRADRDQFIKVNFTNVPPGAETEFTLTSLEADTFGESEYDFESIMHYDQCAYSCNGYPTMKAKDSNTKLGINRNLSKSDINRVKKMYGCPL